MKIRIASGSHKFVIPVPYFMMDNPVSLLVVRKALQNDEYQIDPEIALKLIKEFSKTAKLYKGLELVRVETSGGQCVQIVL